jgi:predicted amidophosphoribosyltransferase
VTSAARHRAPSGTVWAAWSALADLVLPRGCGGCARPGAGWCPVCAQALSGAPTRRVLDAGLVVWSAARYEDPVRSAVVRWKDRGRADLCRPLAVGLRRAAAAALREASGSLLPAAGRASERSPHPAGDPAADLARDLARDPVRDLARDLAADLAAPLALVPMPSSRRSRRARGHEPVRDLARTAASGLRRRGLPVMVLPVLRQSGRVADQAGLGSAERQRNLAGALVVRPGWRPRLDARPVLLVDDVVTTGSTLTEARRVLVEAGAVVLGAATVASTPLHRPHRK